MAVRQCPFCGKKIPENCGRDCPLCHETLPERRFHHSSSKGSDRNTFRRGLFYMMCVAAIYYFMSPSSPYQVHLPYPSVLTTWLLPFFFLMGLGFAVYGVYQRAFRT